MRRYLLFLSKEENSLTVTSYKNRCKPCVPKDRRILWSLKNVVCGGWLYLSVELHENLSNTLPRNR